MRLGQKITSGVFWLATESWASQAMSLVIYVMLARLLGPEAFGLFGMAMILIMIGDRFLQEGFTVALVQLKDLETAHIDSTFWIMAGLGVSLMLVVVPCASPVARLFGNPEVADLIVVLSPLFVLSALAAVPTALIQRDLRFRILAIRTMVAAALGGVIGVTLALWGYGVWSLVGLLYAQKLAEQVFLWTAVSWRPAADLSLRHFRDVRQFGVAVLAMRVIDCIDLNLPRLLAGVFLNATAVGHLAMATRLVGYLTDLVGRPLQGVAVPSAARVQDQDARTQRLLESGAQASVLVAFPALAGLAAVASEFVVVVLGERWLPSTVLLQLLALSAMPYSVTTVNLSVMLGRGKAIGNLSVTVVGACLVAALLLFFLPAGLAGVGAAKLSRDLIMLVFTLLVFVLLVKLRVLPQLRRCVMPLIGTGTMVAAVTVWRMVAAPTLSPEVILLVAVPLGVVVYAGTLSLLAPSIVREVWHLILSAVGVAQEPLSSPGGLQR